MTGFLITTQQLQQLARERVERRLSDQELARVLDLLSESFKLNGKLRSLVYDAIHVVAGEEP